MNLTLLDPAVPPESALVRHMGAKAEAAAATMKALGHAQRLMILCHLVTGARTVSEIEAKLGARQAAVSQHLARLRQDGLVSAERDGKSVVYDIASPQVRRLVEALYEIYCP